MDFWQQLRFAVRTLRRSPMVTVVAAGSLALALAGNTTLFSLLSLVLFRQPDFVEPNRLVLLAERPQADTFASNHEASALSFYDWRESLSSFQAMAASRMSTFAVETGGGSELIAGASVSPGFFDVLGVVPLRGRLLQPSDGQDRVALLTYQLWRSRFGERAEVVGEEVRINGEPHVIVGILPETFDLPANHGQVLVPLVLEGDARRDPQKSLAVYARLGPGVDIDSARAELKARMQQLEVDAPDTHQGLTADVLSVVDDIPSPSHRRVLYIIQGALVFVLLIACCNIANLLLARSHSREREFAIRTSLGAGKKRIARQLIAESLVLAGGGGLLGLLLTMGGVRLLHVLVEGRMIRGGQPEVDGTVLAFTFVLAALSGIVFGLVPAIQSVRFDLVTALKEGSRSTSESRRKRRVTSVLVIVELTVALLCLGGAAVMLQSFHALRNSDPRFDTGPLLTAAFQLPESWGEGEELAGGVDTLVRRLEALPGVVSLAVSNGPVRSLKHEALAFEIVGRDPEGAAPTAARLAIGPRFFETAGIDVLQGRTFRGADRAVAVVNATAAQRYWPASDVLQARFRAGGQTYEIIGVVADVRHSLSVKKEWTPTVYLPWWQTPQRDFFMTLRIDGDPAKTAGEFRGVVQELDPMLSAVPVQTLESFLDEFYTSIKIYQLSLAALGGLALFLAALGTYGVMAYSVAMRTHEIGVRLAMGAERGEILSMVTRHGVSLTAVGFALATPMYLGLVQVIASVLENHMPVEPTIAIWVAAGMFLVSVGASLVPALRASRVDPVKILRAE